MRLEHVSLKKTTAIINNSMMRRMFKIYRKAMKWRKLGKNSLH